MASGLENIETVESPFRRFVTTIGVFPTAFTDAMTYYECLAYLVKYMEDTMIPAINENAEAVEELQGLYIQLKAFVDNYFDNLDVQDEINNKLDEMAEDGTLQELINNYLQPNVSWTFDNVESMKSSTNLVDVGYAETCGFYALNDGGGAKYKIRQSTNDDVIDEMFIIALADETLVAELIIGDELHTKQIGLKGDGTTDETTKLNIFFEKSVNCNKRVVDRGVYKTSDIVYIKGLWRQDTGNNGHNKIVFEDASIYYTGTSGNASVVLYNMFKYTVNGLCITRNSESNYVQMVGCWHINYQDWDIADLHIDNDITNLTGKTYSSTSNEYVGANNVYVKGTLTIGATSPAYTNVISFYNSVIYSTGKTYCVNLLGATSKQNILFISCDLSYATTSVFNINDTQTGGASITTIACYYDSGIKVFSDNDKKKVLYTNIAGFSAANTNAEKQNLEFKDYNKNGVISGTSPFGNNLPLGNVNYAYNGDLSFNTGVQADKYNTLMGPSSSAWTKSWETNSKAIHGKARRLSSLSAGTKTISIEGVEVPRTDEYCGYIHFEVVSGSFDTLNYNFKGQYLAIPFSEVSGKECMIINNKNKNTITAGNTCNSALEFTNASADLVIDFYEVGVTSGNTVIPNMPLDSRAVITG